MNFKDNAGKKSWIITPADHTISLSPMFRFLLILENLINFKKKKEKSACLVLINLLSTLPTSVEINLRLLKIAKEDLCKRSMA